MSEGPEGKLIAQVMKDASDPLDFRRVSPEIQQRMIELSLDPPDILISRNGEGEKVRRRVEYIFNHQHDLPSLIKILDELGLNDGVYDEEKNPGGLFLQLEERVPKRRMHIVCALYMLSDVHVSILHNFFGVTNYYSDQFKWYSPALSQTIAKLRRLRNEFVFSRVSDIPPLKKAEERIKRDAGLSISQLFARDSIPPIYSYKNQLPLVSVVHAYAVAVSGQLTVSEICRMLKISPAALKKIFKNQQKGVRLSEEALEVLNKKMKKGK